MYLNKLLSTKLNKTHFEGNSAAISLHRQNSIDSLKQEIRIHSILFYLMSLLLRDKRQEIVFDKSSSSSNSINNNIIQLSTKSNRLSFIYLIWYQKRVEIDLAKKTQRKSNK